MSYLTTNKHRESITYVPIRHLSTIVENIRQISLFLQNKPNFKYAQINLNSFITSKYVKLDNWLNWKTKPIQTQFKAKTNPIAKSPKMNVKPCNIMKYKKFLRLLDQKNKANSNPIQTQTKPVLNAVEWANFTYGKIGELK